LAELIQATFLLSSSALFLVCENRARGEAPQSAVELKARSSSA
jgi:hypothetical protein